MTDREPEGMSSLTRTGRIHMLLAGTAFASIAVAASHLDWTGKPDVLGPLGWLVTATAIATGAALVVPSIRASPSASSSGSTTPGRSSG